MYINKGICEVIEDNKMGFAQYIIKNRALPDVYSGMKPIHEKIIWSMFFNKTFDFTKSLSVAGDAMKYTPHGSPYETMVYMAQEDRHIYNLLIGHGNFGSATSTKIQYGADRYTEVKLSALTIDCLEGIKHDMVDMINNYDNSRKLPKHIPTKYPLILTMASNGMAEGMANNSPSFNLEEVCNATISAIKNEDIPMLIPDFATGGFVINDEHIIKQINKHGTGSVVLRSKWHSEDNDIIITEIPYGVKISVESIINKIVELYKQSKLKEITDVKDLTDKDGLRIKIACKKNVNHEKLMNTLFKITQLEANFSCNMNVLVEKEPKVLGVHDTIKEWIKFRRDCILRGLSYDIKTKEIEYSKLLALKSILLDIDKSIDIIRHSDNPQDELIKYFKIDDVQAEFILSKPLRQINEKDILKQLKDIDDKKNELDKLKETVKDQVKMDEIIINDLKETIKKFKQPRRTQVISRDDVQEIHSDSLIEDFTTTLVMSKLGYFKKTRKYNETQNVKDGDEVQTIIQCSNKDKAIFISNLGNAYFLNLWEVDEKKPSQLGEFLPKLLPLEKDESIIGMLTTNQYKGEAVLVYPDGHLTIIPLQSYYTKQNSTRLKNCLAKKLGLPVLITQTNEDVDIEMTDNFSKTKIVNTNGVNRKDTKNAQGVWVWNSKKTGFNVISAKIVTDNK
jgi:DNA gyrase/topoisomerase IV subunit A